MADLYERLNATRLRANRFKRRSTVGRAQHRNNATERREKLRYVEKRNNI
jgi:hypothetical protein